MKNVLILANSDGGLYKFRKELIQELIKNKYEVYACVPNGQKIELLKKLGCKLINIEIDRRGKNPISDFKLLLKYNKLIKQIEPDIVLTYTIKPNIYGGILCRIKKMPYLVNITGLGSGIENNNILTKIILKLYRYALKKANCVFCQNSSIFDFLVENQISSNLRLIPGSGVNIKDFEIENYPNNNTQVFLFIGRIMKEKGIDEYLEAAKVIKQKYKNTLFKIVGSFDDKYQEKIEESAQERIIEYCGYVSDIKGYIKESNCIILPSYHEGTSNALLESAAMGRPVIASNIPGCREIIENEVTGYVFELKNTNELIEKIEKFLKLSYEEKKQMGLKGRQKVEKEFDRNIVINAYKEEIEKILGGK